MTKINDLLIYALSHNGLFKNIEKTELVEIINEINISILDYEKDSTLFLGGDPCENLGIILEGEVELQNILPSGKISRIARLGKGSTFGEAIIFSSKSHYPITVVASEKVKVAFINKTQLVLLMKACPQALENYLSILSNRLVMLNLKIKSLSMGTIREKICDFLVEEYKKQKSLSIRLKITKKDLADFMAVQRPSLSRELSNMEDEGIIQVEKNIITILDMSRIEELI